MKKLKNLLQERRANPRKEQSDFYDYVLKELKKEGTILTEAIALDLMFVLLFASFETTSVAITLAIKFLSENPLVLKQLTVWENLLFEVTKIFLLLFQPTCSTCLYPSQEEHEAILKNRENVHSGLTWREYKSMTYTFQVGFHKHFFICLKSI